MPSSSTSSPGPQDHRGQGDDVGAPGAPADRPWTVTWLIQATGLSLLLHMAGSVVSVAAIFSAPMRDELLERFGAQGLSGDFLHEQALRTSLVSASLGNIVIGLFIASVFVVVILGIVHRWDWARWLGLVMSVLFGLWNLWRIVPPGVDTLAPGVYGTASWIISILLLLVNLIWLVLAFTRPVTVWFARSSVGP